MSTALRSLLGKFTALSARQPRVIVIEPSRGWRALQLEELIAYRDLLFVLISRDIRVRYKQTVLGFAWAIIQPVMLMVVFSVFFGRLAGLPSQGYPYPIFVYAALLPWTFFANAATASGNSLVNSSQLVSKVYFPRLIIPMAAVGAGLVDFLIASAVLFALMAFYKVGWTVNLLVAPGLLIGLVFVALGVGTLLSALNVAYRDFRYVIPFMLQFWLFCTPVVYPTNLVPGGWHLLYYLNPLTGIVDGFRSAFLGHPFNWLSLAISFVMAIAILILGVAYFERVERRFADII